MPELDGSISTGAGILFAAALIAVNIYAGRRYGMVPKSEHLRDPRGIPYGAFWNLLSEKKWTAEGIDLHRQYLLFMVKVGAGLVFLWLVLDFLT